MAGLLDNQEIEIPCPKCKTITKKSVGWIKANSTFICACGSSIRLDASQFKSSIAKIDDAVQDLKNTFKKLNK